MINKIYEKKNPFFIVNRLFGFYDRNLRNPDSKILFEQPKIYMKNSQYIYIKITKLISELKLTFLQTN